MSVLFFRQGVVQHLPEREQPIVEAPHAQRCSVKQAIAVPGRR